MFKAFFATVVLSLIFLFGMRKLEESGFMDGLYRKYGMK